jgi:DNA-binding NtrC family response regulator
MGAEQSDNAATLLAIIELGGYPNLTPLYRDLGLDFTVVTSQRKAQAALKRQVPDIIVAEYNFQSDFRDRTSNLETLMAILQRHPGVRVICFYLPEVKPKLDLLMARFPIFEAIPFPVDPKAVEVALKRALMPAGEG